MAKSLHAWFSFLTRQNNKTKYRTPVGLSCPQATPVARKTTHMFILLKSQTFLLQEPLIVLVKSWLLWLTEAKQKQHYRK